MTNDNVAVLGAGFVGVSCALHLARRGLDVTLIDKAGPAGGASFGNAGIIQREAVVPYAFPRALSKILSVLPNRGIDIRYHATALPRSAMALARYWWHSAPSRHDRAGRAYETLIAHSLVEHGRQVDWAGEPAARLIRRDGWYELNRTEAGLAAALSKAKSHKETYGVEFTRLSSADVATLEPHLQERFAGAIHWPDTWTVSDPGALNHAYADAVGAAGGRLMTAEVAGITRHQDRWVLSDGSGRQIADVATVVVATGAWSGPLLRQLGYRPPLFVKRGYHQHFRPVGNKPLGHWIADLETGFLLAPMEQGIRLTTGAELGLLETRKTPGQVEAAERVARRMFPMGDAVEAEPWMGGRPCTPDMLPVIGPAPGQDGLWYAFGHGHQGLTLGPVTGRLLAEMICGDTPVVDPAPFTPARFA